MISDRATVDWQLIIVALLIAIAAGLLSRGSVGFVRPGRGAIVELRRLLQLRSAATPPVVTLDSFDRPSTAVTRSEQRPGHSRSVRVAATLHTSRGCILGQPRAVDHDGRQTISVPEHSSRRAVVGIPGSAMMNAIVHTNTADASLNPNIPCMPQRSRKNRRDLVVSIACDSSSSV